MTMSVIGNLSEGRILSMNKDENKPSLDCSVVLPVFNEEGCLETILSRILSALNPMQKTYEVICVDDGSSDRTWDIITKVSQLSKNVKGIKFQRNFGHQIAICAGIQHSAGQYIAILDADGQDPPELLPKLFQECMKGNDVVYAVRTKRKENIFKQMAYRAFYRFYKLIMPFPVPLDSGDFGVFNRKVADFINNLPEKTPFIRGLRSWYGGKQVGIEYERQARTKGKPKYNFFKLIVLAVNGSMSFSKMPLRFFALFGTLIAVASGFFGLVLLFYKMTVGIDLLGWTSTTLLITFFGGINLMVLGVLGEYIGNIFDEVKNRPRYLINHTTGF